MSTTPSTALDCLHPQIPKPCPCDSRCYCRRAGGPCGPSTVEAELASLRARVAALEAAAAKALHVLELYESSEWDERPDSEEVALLKDVLKGAAPSRLLRAAARYRAAALTQHATREHENG